MILSHTDYLELRRFDRLDGLRALSILLVFTAHPASKQFWPLFHGPAGVTLFFVLSGFLITTLLLREEERTGRVDFGSFYLRRFFRIYPMFFLVFALYCVLIFGLGMQPDRRDAFASNIPYFLLFFPEHAIFLNHTGVAVPFNMAWSIGVEEKFYFVWPLIGFALLAHRQGRRLPVLLAVLVTATVISLLRLPWSDVVAPYAHIAMGSIAAVLLHSPVGYQKAALLGRRWVLAATSLTAIALQLGTKAILDGGRLYVVHGLVLTCVLIGVVVSRHPEYNWLSSRPMVYLGSLSYVLYLIHNFGLNFAEALIPKSSSMPWSLVSTALGIGGSVLVAHFIHAWFEEPLRRIGVQLSHKRRARFRPLMSADNPPIEEAASLTPRPR